LSVPDILTEVEKQILDFYENHVTPYGGDGDLDVSMIIGAMDGNQKKLWVTEKSVVNEACSFAAVGAGEMYAAALMGNLFAPMNTVGAILLAAFVISEVKQAVEGCGNDTDIFSVCKGNTYCIERSHTRKLEDIFRGYSRISANRLHELFCRHSGWPDMTKSATDSEAESLRSEVEKIIASFEEVPEWAKGDSSK
jgi:hypothetical protein